MQQTVINTKRSGAEQFGRIRRTILVRVLMLPFIILLIICGTLVHYLATNIYDHVRTELVIVTEDHRRLIEQFFVERVRDLQFITATVNLTAIAEDHVIETFLNHLRLKSEAFSDLGVFDDEGNHLAYAGPYDLAGKNYAEAEWFKAVRQRPVYISDVFLGFRQTPHFIVVVKNHSGSVPWYLRATIDMRYFNSLVEDIRIGETGEAYLINQNGILQTKTRSGARLMTEDPDFDLYPKDKEQVTPFLAKGAAGNRYFYTIGYLDPTGWRLVIRQKASDVFFPLIKAVIIASLLVLIGGAMVVLIAFFLATTVANRLTLAEVEKREMGSQLIMAGKLAEIGEMSAGMAHEINNPLQIMAMEFTMIRDVFDDFSDGRTLDEEARRIIRDSMDQIGLQINRCRDITHGLLKFSRKSELHLQPLNMSSLIEDSVQMVAHQAQLQSVTIERHIDDQLPTVHSDSEQLRQVLVNLLNNALYAVRDRIGGMIGIMVKKAANGVDIEVSDNGCGIKPEDLEKIFVPFYTTKPVGKGTGLGLSTCYGIIERLGGTLSVKSQPGAGSMFTVSLPLPSNMDKHTRT